jgi:hypothetical protein
MFGVKTKDFEEKSLKTGNFDLIYSATENIIFSKFQFSAFFF